MSLPAPYAVTRATRASRIGGGAFAVFLAALATFPLWADRGFVGNSLARPRSEVAQMLCDLLGEHVQRMRSELVIVIQ